MLNGMLISFGKFRELCRFKGTYCGDTGDACSHLKCQFFSEFKVAQKNVKETKINSQQQILDAIDLLERSSNVLREFDYDEDLSIEIWEFINKQRQV